jgi:phosphoribosylaminoimidazolecarboxamide formyltransferase / IMP cyclohydrolase
LKKIKSALISVFNKEGLDAIVNKLAKLEIEIFSTGGTQDFIEKLGVKVIPVEELTSYPSILGGRVKTLHPKVFGGILSRRENKSDVSQLEEFEIPEIDLVIVDLYPFEKTLLSAASEEEIIEKIDIGGISLIRAAAKNYNDVVIIPSIDQYQNFIELLDQKNGFTNLADRKLFAAHAFNVTSHYDTAIFNYFNQTENIPVFKNSFLESKALRYGENPHQKGIFFGKLNEVFEQLNGKELSYNNLLDVDAAINLINEFRADAPTFAVIKHNNACGIATKKILVQAWQAALAADPLSAFGGVLITNCKIDLETAQEINNLFFEILIAPAYSDEALLQLKSKKNRIILVQKLNTFQQQQSRTILNGLLVQDKDSVTETENVFQYVTKIKPTSKQIDDLIFANKVAKHTKSNTIVLAKDKTLLGSGTGQTSRVDALKQAIEKAKNFGFNLKGAAMASDAFFPFPDCVEIAGNAGIETVIHPGGSIKDQESIDYCNNNNISMVITGTRHFKH